MTTTITTNSTDLVFIGHNPVKIVATLKNQLLLTLKEDRTNVLTHQKHQQLLEQLIEQIRNFMCGNFFTKPAKDIFDNFQLERELVEQDVLGYFIVNLDRLSEHVSRHLIEIFVHIITNYAYQTRRPLAEALVDYDYLLSELCRFVCHPSDTASIVSTQMLTACCEHFSLARKLVNLSIGEINRTSGIVFYIQLLQQIPGIINFNQLAQIFKFLRALLLINDEVTIYAFNRDMHQLIKAFNVILGGHCHQYARFKCLFLFGDLIQNRKLQTFINAYTTNSENLMLFYDWAMKKLHSIDCKQEFIKIFEVFRLFYLNPNNINNNEFKKFAMDNYLMITSIVDNAERMRSYSDLALMYPEYNDVRKSLDQMAGKPSKGLSRSDSSDSI